MKNLTKKQRVVLEHILKNMSVEKDNDYENYYDINYTINYNMLVELKKIVEKIGK